MKTRKFGNHQYDYYGTVDFKSTADRVAEDMKDKNFNVRMVKVRGRYHIYTRKQETVRRSGR